MNVGRCTGKERQRTGEGREDEEKPARTIAYKMVTRYSPLMRALVNQDFSATDGSAEGDDISACVLAAVSSDHVDRHRLRFGARNGPHPTSGAVPRRRAAPRAAHLLRPASEPCSAPRMNQLRVHRPRFQFSCS